MSGDIGAICQKVQISAVPDACNREVHDAQLIVDALWNRAPGLGVLKFSLVDDLDSSINIRPVVRYGNSPMIPVVGDWAGDGIDPQGIVR
ncbi:hypothetical protein [Streptosporangium sp. NPDC048865]|uniref:hypothetical protein n=1 Tax=Streptosporangium sp. NPDC048865 TaxID=3155766 RepID=UPI0034152D70